MKAFRCHTADSEVLVFRPVRQGEDGRVEVVDNWPLGNVLGDVRNTQVLRMATACILGEVPGDQVG
jgi:hypothetical protein